MVKVKEFDPDALIDDYFAYVEQYRLASASLPSSGTLFPNQQIRGLLLELVLKTYLCASKKDARGHDLDKLATYAIENGLYIKKEDIVNIIKPINDIYFEGGPWEHRYLCRYPKSNRGLFVTSTPTHHMVNDLVDRVVFQAKELRKA